jgi:hypothetical protein
MDRRFALGARIACLAVAAVGLVVAVVLVATEDEGSEVAEATAASTVPDLVGDFGPDPPRSSSRQATR